MEQWSPGSNLNNTDIYNTSICDDENRLTPIEGLTNYSLIFLILLTVMTAPANLLAIVALNRENKSIGVSGFKIYAISLALTDLSNGILIIPMTISQQAKSWLLGDISCVVFKILDYRLGTVSVFLMTVMGFDRFKCVSSPFLYRSNFRVRRVVLQCIVLWISGIAVWIPGFVTLFMQQVSFIRDGYCKLYEYGYYSLIQAVFVIYLPLIVTIIVYTKLVLNLRKRFQSGVLGEVVRPGVYSVSSDCCPGHQTDLAVTTNYPTKYVRKTGNSNTSLKEIDTSKRAGHTLTGRGKTLCLKSPGSTHSRISAQNRQCIKTSLIVVVVFIVCWGPFCVVWPLYQICQHCVNMDLYDLLARLPYANSAINPFIYILSSHRVRSLIKTQLLKLCGKNSG